MLRLTPKAARAVSVTEYAPSNRRAAMIRSGVLTVEIRPPGLPRMVTGRCCVAGGAGCPWGYGWRERGRMGGPPGRGPAGTGGRAEGFPAPAGVPCAASAELGIDGHDQIVRKPAAFRRS